MNQYENDKSKMKENEVKLKKAIMRLFFKNILCSLLESLNSDNLIFVDQFLDYEPVYFNKSTNQTTQSELKVAKDIFE